MADGELAPAATAAAPEATALELRVLAGRNAGASVPVAHGRWLSVGHAFTNDIVLRDASARGVKLRLRPTDGAAELDLLEGEVEILGHPATAPATALLPSYVPLILGDSALALGEPGAARWPEATRLLAASRPAQAFPKEAERAPPRSAVESALERLPNWRLLSPAARAVPDLKPLLPIGVGALVAVVLAAAGWAGLSRLLSAVPPPAKVTAALAADGFHGLAAEPAGDGLVIRGVVPHDRDVERLRQDVARHGWPARLIVRTNDALVQNVSDILRTNGFDADVKAIGSGVIAAGVRGGDPTALEQLRRRILHDVTGLRDLVVNGGAGSGNLFVDDPNKRVVSVVGGAEGFIQTADGSRYFVGAVLPDGHTITSIANQSATVEKDGKLIELRF